MAIIENEYRIIVNRGEQRDMNYGAQILSGLEAKRYKRLRRIIANAGEFTG